MEIKYESRRCPRSITPLIGWTTQPNEYVHVCDCHAMELCITGRYSRHSPLLRNPNNKKKKENGTRKKRQRIVPLLCFAAPYSAQCLSAERSELLSVINLSWCVCVRKPNMGTTQPLRQRRGAIIFHSKSASNFGVSKSRSWALTRLLNAPNLPPRLHDGQPTSMISRQTTAAMITIVWIPGYLSLFASLRTLPKSLKVARISYNCGRWG